MSANSLFLDSNIFMGYALDATLERYHSECCHVFDKTGRPIHTSLTVRQELRNKARVRRRLYADLMKHCLSGGQIKTFKIKDLNKSEQNHLIGIVSSQHKGGKPDVEYLRLLEKRFYARLTECLYKKTSQPFIPYSEDGNMKSDFGLLGLHSPDDSVLADFFSWALPGGGSAFVTADNGIHRLRSDILKSVAESKMADCSHLSIDHVSDAISRFPSS